MANCAMCGEKIGGFGGVDLAPAERLVAARKTGVYIREGICIPCSLPLIREARARCSKILEETLQSVQSLLSSIEIATYPPDSSLKFKYCGIVSVQSAINTGRFSKKMSSETDFFDKNPYIYERKLQRELLSCMDKIQYDAMGKGANAVYGTSITYAERPNQQYMVLVSITGTAICILGENENIQDKYKSLLKYSEDIEETLQELGGPI